MLHAYGTTDNTTAQDHDVWALVAPEVKSILGYVPTNGLVSVLDQQFTGYSTFHTDWWDHYKHMAAQDEIPSEKYDWIEGRLKLSLDAYTASIREYQRAAFVVGAAALMLNRLDIRDRAIKAIRDYEALRFGLVQHFENEFGPLPKITRGDRG